MEEGDSELKKVLKRQLLPTDEIMMGWSVGGKHGDRVHPSKN
jgi:hypothetical protein